jgi:hypothetical protein
MGKPAATDRRRLKSLNHSFTLDLVVVCRTRRDAEQALQAVTQVLQKLRLTAHPTKTRIVDM